jgi:hypothetical protein
MPTPDEPSEISEQRAAELLEWQREDERARRREFWGTVLAMIGSSALGCLVMAQGFRVTDEELGRIFILAGILVGQSLILGILVRAWLRQRDE